MMGCPLAHSKVCYQGFLQMRSVSVIALLTPLSKKNPIVFGQRVYLVVMDRLSAN